MKVIIDTKHPSWETLGESDAGLNQLKMGLLMDPVLPPTFDFYFKLAAQLTGCKHSKHNEQNKKLEKLPIFIKRLWSASHQL